MHAFEERDDKTAFLNRKKCIKFNVNKVPYRVQTEGDSNPVEGLVMCLEGCGVGTVVSMYASISDYPTSKAAKYIHTCCQFRPVLVGVQIPALNTKCNRFKIPKIN